MIDLKRKQRIILMHLDGKSNREIFAMIESDGDTLKDYQEERDFIVRSLVKSIKYNLEQIKEIDI